MNGESTLQFACGCFLSFIEEHWALACCSRHEKPYQTIAGILLHEPLFMVPSGPVQEVGECDRCGVTVVRNISYRANNFDVEMYTDAWEHTNPDKQSYRKKACAPMAPNHSTPPLPFQPKNVRYAR